MCMSSFLFVSPLELPSCKSSKVGTDPDSAILPTRELAAYPRCSVCEHPSSRERPSARRSQPAPALVDGFSWQPGHVPWYGSSGRADSFCSGQTDSWKLLSSCTGSGTSASGNIPAAAPSPRACSRGVAHTECVIIMVQATVNY